MVLASPVAGTGVTLSMLHATCVRLLTDVEPEDRPAWIRAFVAEQPLKLFDGDRAVTDKEEQARVLEQQLADVSTRRVPELLQLGILEETTP